MRLVSEMPVPGGTVANQRTPFSARAKTVIRSRKARKGRNGSRTQDQAAPSSRLGACSRIESSSIAMRKNFASSAG